MNLTHLADQAEAASADELRLLVGAYRELVASGRGDGQAIADLTAFLAGRDRNNTAMLLAFAVRKLSAQEAR